jgi:hypothetical protein
VAVLGRRRFLRGVPVVFLALAFATSPAVSQPPEAFTEEAVERGLDFTMQPYPQLIGYVGQGVGFVDLDVDGDPDVVILGRVDGRVGIFENIGGGNFVDHTLTSGIPVLSQQEAFAAADYDADGLPDLYLTQANNFQNYLMKNEGSFTFTDVTLVSGVSNGPQNSTAPSWGDYNNDGWPDLYVCNYGQSNALYRNNGLSGNFSNLGTLLGVSVPTALSFQSVWTDFDRDGDVDLLLSNDRAPQGFPANFLWRNDAGIGFFDVSTTSGAGVSLYSMGLAAGDLDNNAYPDYYFTNINAWENDGSTVVYDGINPLLVNQGDGTLVEQAELWAVDNHTTSWAAIFFDWDNDGRLDLYVNNQFEPNAFFHCGNAPPCTEMAEQIGIQAAHELGFELPDDPPSITSYNSAVADVDGDGDLDLLVNNLGYRAELFINHEGDQRNWVRYDVVGVYPNLFALGVGVETTVAGVARFHESYAGGNGYLGQNERIVHVGLDAAETVDETVVQWPSGGPARTLTGLPAGETWTIYPPGRLCDADGNGLDHDDFEAFAACFLAGFSPGCEMMDEDGDSSIYVDDLSECFVTAPQDCNANGTEDLAEILLDLSLDVDQNDIIDCCENQTPRPPNPVGFTVLGTRTVGREASFDWSAPAVDGLHDAASSYDVFRSTSASSGIFHVQANVTTETHTDSDTSPSSAYYLVSARNGCGSSGEEPF